jgi:hypothetical protein
LEESDQLNAPAALSSGKEPPATVGYEATKYFNVASLNVIIR